MDECSLIGKLVEHTASIEKPNVELAFSQSVNHDPPPGGLWIKSRILHKKNPFRIERSKRDFMVGHAGLEPATTRLWAGGSNQLS